MAAFGVAAAGLGGAALATPVTILNPSFETVAAGEPTDGNYSLAPHVNTNSIAGTYWFTPFESEGKAGVV